MIVNDLNGISSAWKISVSPKSKKRNKTSNYHSLAKSLLGIMYPVYSICEEIPINIQNNIWLYLDIYLPTINMAIEIHGEQHYSFNVFFHKTQLGFLQQKQNDRLKQEWCKLNNVALICLPYNETTEEWQDRIENYEY